MFLPGPTFSESEKTDIAEALSSVLGFDLKVRAAFEESLDAPALLIIALGTIGTAFLAGFLAKMGSDAWDYAKKKIVDAAARHGNDNGTRIRVRFQHNGAKVICSLRTVDSQIMQKALDELKMVFGKVRDMAAKDQLPGTEAYINYKFRDMKWRIDEATVMQPEFDVLKIRLHNRQLGAIRSKGKQAPRGVPTKDESKTERLMGFFFRLVLMR